MPDLSRRTFVGGVSSAVAGLSAATRQPNILLICSDNHNPHVVGCAGHSLVRTPNIDRLAREGTYFDNCYCGSPVCVPARASLFSGMFPSDVDSYCNATPFQGQVPTWGDRLREAGYVTKAVGKMDLTTRGDLGFDQVDTVHGHDSQPDVTALFRRPLCYRIDERRRIDGQVLRSEHGDANVTRNALRFLRDEAPGLSQPWALFVGYIGPLPGFLVEPAYYEMYPPGQVDLPRIPPGYLETLPEPWQATRAYKRIAAPIPETRVRKARSAYYGNVTALDDRIGELVTQMDRSGLRENTIVIYTTDHGRSLGEHGLWYHNEPTDSSSRANLIIAGPGFPASHRIDTPVMHVDLYPTLVQLAGAAIPSGLRGHSLLPMCRGESGGHPGLAYSECHAEGTCTGSFIIRKGRWKYIHYTYYDDLLFNMEDDPHEMRDLIDSTEGRRARRELEEILRSLVDPTEVTERAFARQEQILEDLCSQMTLAELLEFGFERRMGRAQATALLRKFKS